MDDVPAVYEYFSDEVVSRYEDFWPQTMEDVAQGLSEWKDMDNRMAVILTETGELIGSVGYWVEEEAGNPVYSIDFDFNPRFRHKGYAMEAAREVVRHLTEDLGVKQIHGDCDERNTASAKLLERLVPARFRLCAGAAPALCAGAWARRLRMALSNGTYTGAAA